MNQILAFNFLRGLFVMSSYKLQRETQVEVECISSPNQGHTTFFPQERPNSSLNMLYVLCMACLIPQQLRDLAPNSMRGLQDNSL